MTITTITINSVNYVSYASVTEADEYLAVDPVRATAWAALSVDQKGANLVAATRRLDLLNWVGDKTGGSAQENQWPRTGITLKDGTSQSDSEVPQEVENATIILAGSITLDASNADQGTSGTNTKRLKAGSAEIEFFQPQSGKSIQDETVFVLVRCFLAGASGGTGTGALASGTDGESSFCDVDAPGLTEGYP